MNLKEGKLYSYKKYGHDILFFVVAIIEGLAEVIILKSNGYEVKNIQENSSMDRVSKELKEKFDGKMLKILFG
jgi:hypothetical protein